MKIKRIHLLIMLIILTSSLLSACTGGAGLTSSWPGIAVDSQSDVAYVAQGSFVYAINLQDGTERWRFPEKADNKVSFYAPPALTTSGQLIVGSYNNSLFSINPQNGAQNWVFSKASDKYIGSALASNEIIYTPNNNNTLFALSENGSPLWEFKTEHAIWAMPLTDGERLYIASMDHYVYSLDPFSGEKIWQSKDVGGAVVKSFAFDSEDILYAGTLGGDLVALSAKSGDILWSTSLKGWVWSQAVSSDGELYLADQEGFVYAIDALKGEIRWQVQPDTGTDRAVISTPILVEDTLYFASQAGKLYAIDAASGSPRWNKTIGGKIFSDLKLAGDIILIAPNEFESLLVAVDFQGNNRWTFTPAK